MRLQTLAALVRESIPPEEMSTRVVAIDGLGGAGKSTLATRLGAEIGAPVIHTDDFASWDTPLAWWPRMLEQVLLPLSRNETARFQRYDWEARALAEWHDVAPAPIVIVEGVSSSRTEFRRYLSFAVWVNTPRATRLERGLERDGEGARELWDEWMRAEDAWVAADSPAECADLVLAGDEALEE